MHTRILLLVSVFMIGEITPGFCQSTSDQAQGSQVITDTIFSSSLDSQRQFTIYLPSGFNPSQKYPVVYCTDGQAVVEEYKEGLDSLIRVGAIPEIIMVGVFSNEQLVPDKEFEYRNYEYIKGWANDSDADLSHLYENHLEFFSVEVPAFMKRKYGIEPNRENTLFYGFSNGAGFGISLSFANLEFAKTYICFSLAGANYGNISKKRDNSRQPFYYFGYGNQEPPPLIMASQDFEKFLNKRKIPHQLFVYEGGHTRDKWKQEFFRVLTIIFK